MADSNGYHIGIIGTGDLGTTIGEQFNDHPKATVTAITDVSDDARKVAGDTLGVGDARYSNYTEMLDNEDFDAVAVTTPHSFHYEHVVELMDRDLHVYCEKPLTIDVEEAKDIVRRDEASDRVLMVGYQRHIFPPFVRARKRWHGTDLEPEFITAETTQEWIRKFRSKWRGDPDLSGGGQLYDTGNHLLDSVLWMTGLTPMSVCAEMVFDDDERRVDKHAVLTIQFENGAVATVSVSGDTRQRREYIHVTDREGGAYIENQIELYEFDADGTEQRVELDFGSRQNKAEAFIEALETGRDPPATARDALAVTALTEAAYESARTGDRVDVPVDGLAPRR